jgi:fibro-slime domain-containing protein
MNIVNTLNEIQVLGRRSLVMLAIPAFLVACGGSGGSGGASGSGAVAGANVISAVDTQGTGAQSGDGKQGSTSNQTTAASQGTASSTPTINVSTPKTVFALSKDTQFAFIQRSVSNDATLKMAQFKEKAGQNKRSLLDLVSTYDFRPGAKLIVRNSLDVNGADTEILSSYFQSSDYDVKDLNVSPDGTKLLFAAHGPMNHPTDYTWNIYEFDFNTKAVRRIIQDNTIANAAQDTSPTYAMDGTIVFSSNRSAGNPNSPIDNIIDEDQKDYCYKVGPEENPSLLHSMTHQGQNILQLTYGRNHDTKAITLRDGRIAFIRWSRTYDLIEGCPTNDPSVDNVFASNYARGLAVPGDWTKEQMCQYAEATPLGKVFAKNHYTVLRITADGKQLQKLYNTVALKPSDENFLSMARLVQGENGQLTAVLQHQFNNLAGGNIIELQSPAAPMLDKVFSNVAPNQLLPGSIDIYPSQVSINGWYSAVAPYNDGTNRVLTSWSQCISESGGVSAFCNAGTNPATVGSRYGIWVVDRNNNSRLPIVRAARDVVYSDLVISQAQSGADFPYDAVDVNFVDDLDTSRIVCNYPVSSSAASYSSYSSYAPSSYASSSYQPSSVPSSAVASSRPVVIPPSSMAASSVVRSSVAASVVPPSSVPASSVAASVVPPSSMAASSVAASVAPSSIAASSIARSSVAASVTPSSVAVSSVSVSSVAPSSVAVSSSSVASSVAANRIPVANAGPDQQVYIGLAVTLDGSASNDPDGDKLTYRWKIMSPVNSVAVLSDETATMPKLTVKEHGTYSIQLIVNDGKMDSVADTVNLEVGNLKPVADAGADQSTKPGIMVQLNGSRSTDTDGDALTYQWRLVSAPAGSVAAVKNATEIVADFTPDQLGMYTLELVVNDGIVNSDPDLVVIDTRNSRPVANAGRDQLVCPNELVLLNGSGSSDADGQKLTYSWSILSQPANSTSKLINPTEDMPQLRIDKQGTYVVQLVVSDGIDVSEPDTVVLTTGNVRPIADAGKDITVFVGDTANLDGSASSDPDGDALTYKWNFVSKPKTSLASLDGALNAKPTFKADAVGTYVVQLVVNDGKLNSKADTITVTVQEPACDISNATKRTLPVVIRDFKVSHPDFEGTLGVDYGIVTGTLGSDGLPVYANKNGKTKTTTGAANFNQWFRDVKGVNLRMPYTLQMTRANNSTLWSYVNPNFFPIDGKGFGNMPKPAPDHNYHFTLEAHLGFDYKGGEVFTFKGDDDLWVYINGKLAIDIGGVHDVIERTIKLDEIAGKLGIQKGKSYKFDLFFAERHTVKSNFMFQTSINLECVSSSNNRSGLGDGTNPGQGSGRDNSPNQGTNNPHN